MQADDMEMEKCGRIILTKHPIIRLDIVRRSRTNERYVVVHRSRNRLQVDVKTMIYILTEEIPSQNDQKSLIDLAATKTAKQCLQSISPLLLDTKTQPHFLHSLAKTIKADQASAT